MLSSTQAWVHRELEPWRGVKLSPAAFGETLDAAVVHHGQMFRYDIAHGQVTRRPKTPFQIGPGVADEIIAAVEARADAYAELLQAALPLSGVRGPLSLGIEVSDIPPEWPGLPFFSFQKLAGGPSLLLPDVDLLALGYLEHDSWRDKLGYFDKRNQAIFVGSTTGEQITRDKVEALSPPRLRAAAFFKASERVVFELPNVVQCDGPETEAAVKALGLGERLVPWSEQLLYRHLLSMDGNGATCSRVAVALSSNSTLLKYDSPYELFYFKGLKPWRHFIPIGSDADVEAVVADAGRHPARYARIAQAGRRFFHRHLRRTACRRYVAALLRGYAGLFDQSSAESD